MFKKLLAAKRKRNLFFKIIAYTMIVSLLPILLLTAFFYHNMKSSMEEEIRNASVNYLNQTVNAVEIVIQQINRSFEQLTLDKAVRDFEGFPRGNYYESIHGSIDAEDLPLLHSYVYSKANVLLMLNNLKTSNDFIYSVHLVDHAKGIVLTTTSPDGGIDENNQVKLEQSELPQQVSAYPYFKETLRIKINENTFKKVIPVIYKSTGKSNEVVVYLDADKMYQNIIRKLENNKEHTFFVLSEGKKLLIDDGNNKFYQKFNEIQNVRGNSLNPSQSEIIENESTNMLVTYKTSELLGWTFVSAVNVEKLYKSISHMNGLILLTAVILLTLTLLLTVLTSRTIYRPIYRMVAYIRSLDSTEKPRNSNSNEQQPHYDELKWIQTSFEAAVEDRMGLQARLNESLPAYKEKFLVSLVKNNRYSTEEITGRMQLFGIEVQLEQLILLNVYVERPDAAASDFKGNNLLKLQLLDLLNYHCMQMHRGFVVEMYDDLFTIVVNGDEHDIAQMIVLAEQLKDEAKQQLDLNCTIGIGQHCPTVYHLSRAFEEAEEAVRYRSIVGTGEVIYIDDVRLESAPILLYPKDKETLLNNYIKKGEGDHAIRVFNEFVKDLKSQEAKTSFCQLQRAFIQLMVSFMETADHLRLDLTKMMHMKQEPYYVLLQLKDFGAIIDWFEGMITQMAAYIHNAFKSKNHHYIEKAIEMMETAQLEQITLTWIADRLHLNASYFSRIFKEKKGISFVDYLTKKRIDTSKQLLIETNMKVNEISDRLGYTQVNYFIRIFKELTGTTPGEYRKSFTAKH